MLVSTVIHSPEYIYIFNFSNFGMISNRSDDFDQASVLPVVLYLDE